MIGTIAGQTSDEQGQMQSHEQQDEQRKHAGEVFGEMTFRPTMKPAHCRLLMFPICSHTRCGV